MSQKNNLVQCLRCKQAFIREEYDAHVCVPNSFKGVRDIEVIQWWETKNEHDERVAFGLGSDGYNYRLTEVKEGFIELDTNNRQLTGRNTNREDNRTCFAVLST